MDNFITYYIEMLIFDEGPLKYVVMKCPLNTKVNKMISFHWEKSEKILTDKKHMKSNGFI